MSKPALEEELLLLFAGLSRVFLTLVTAEAADLAIETVMGDGVTRPILLKATLAFWSLGVTLVEPFCCRLVDNCKSPLGMPGCPEMPELAAELGATDVGTGGKT